MTDDEILEMMRLSGLKRTKYAPSFRRLIEIAQAKEREKLIFNDERLLKSIGFQLEVDKFVKAIEAEREACAKLAAWILKMPENDVSAAIRARGQK